jgi:hypothetical protein
MSNASDSEESGSESWEDESEYSGTLFPVFVTAAVPLEVGVPSFAAFYE